MVVITVTPVGLYPLLWSLTDFCSVFFFTQIQIHFFIMKTVGYNCSVVINNPFCIKTVAAKCCPVSL